MAYYHLEPWGSGVDDLRAGIVASTIANTVRGKNRPPFTPDQFMPRWDLSPQDTSADNARARTERSFALIAERRSLRAEEE